MTGWKGWTPLSPRQRGNALRDLEHNGACSMGLCAKDIILLPTFDILFGFGCKMTDMYMTAIKPFLSLRHSQIRSSNLNDKSAHQSF